MKKLWIVFVVVAVMVFSSSVVLAAGEETYTGQKAAAGKEEGWKPTAEMAIGVHNKYLSEASGALSYDKAMSNQSVMVGLDKNGTGFYLKAENFAPFEKETKETDFYFGFYAEAAGLKFDVGIAHYWVRESNGLDYHAAYAAVDFPAIFWQIVPFIKAEYNFAKGSSEISMDGFMYYVGLRREFQLHERVVLITELGGGGNTGIYGMPAENLAFAREKVEISVSLVEQWKLKVSALTQQNLGKSAGIAANTGDLFAGIAIAWVF